MSQPMGRALVMVAVGLAFGTGCKTAGKVFRLGRRQTRPLSCPTPILAPFEPWTPPLRRLPTPAMRIQLLLCMPPTRLCFLPIFRRKRAALPSARSGEDSSRPTPFASRSTPTSWKGGVTWPTTWDTTASRRYPRPKASGVADEGKFLEILKKQPDGSWKYVVDMYSSNLAPQH